MFTIRAHCYYCYSLINFEDEVPISHNCEKLELASPIKCIICNSVEHYYHLPIDRIKKMLNNQHCYRCSVWDEYIENTMNKTVACINGFYYTIDNSSNNEDLLKPDNYVYGAKKLEKFTIRFFNGEVIYTNNLFLFKIAKIPKLFKQFLPDNAEFINE